MEKQYIKIILLILIVTSISGGMVDFLSPAAQEKPEEPTTDTTVRTFGDELSINVTRTSARVESITGTESAPEHVTVYVHIQQPSSQSSKESTVNSFSSQLVNMSYSPIQDVGATTHGTTVYLEYVSGTSENRIEQILAHVLQPDDLNEQLTTTIGSDYVRTSDGQFVKTSIVEGGATYVTNQYTRSYLPNTLTQSEQLEMFWQTGPTGSRLLQSPYLFGAQYFEKQLDSPQELGQVYASLPRTTKQLLHNLNQEDDSLRPLTAQSHLQNNSWNELTTDTKGELYIRVLLEDRLANQTARQAAEGWENDRLVTYDNGSVTGYVWVLRWNSKQNAEQFVDAFNQFMDQQSTSSNTVKIHHLDSETVLISVGPHGFSPTGETDGETVSVII